MKRKLSEAVVEALKPATPGTSSYITWDTVVPGFAVRTTEAGTKSLILNYSFKGTERRMVLARYYPDQNTVALARSKAAELKNQIIAGKDPIAVELAAEEARDKQFTFAELALKYQRDYRIQKGRKRGLPKRQASVVCDRSMLYGGKRKRKGAVEGVQLVQRFGSRKLNTITTDEIQALMKEIPTQREDGTWQGRYRANRIRALLHSMFEWARSKDGGKMMTTPNPVSKEDVLKYQEDEKEFFLEDAQILDFLNACDRYPDQNAADALRLLLETGSRKSEVLGARWEMFHFKAGPLQNMWVKPKEMTKQGKIEHLPLGARALALLRKMGPKEKGYLFPGKSRFDKPRVDLTRPWTQICRAAGLTTAVTKPGKRRHSVTKHVPILRLHDLRHSYASYLVSRGWSLERIGKLLGHERKSTATARYAKVSPESAREAANAFLADAPPAKKPPVKIVSQQSRKRRKL